MTTSPTSYALAPPNWRKMASAARSRTTCARKWSSATTSATAPSPPTSPWRWKTISTTHSISMRCAMPLEPSGKSPRSITSDYTTVSIRAQVTTKKVISMPSRFPLNSKIPSGARRNNPCPNNTIKKPPPHTCRWRLLSYLYYCCPLKVF